MGWIWDLLRTATGKLRRERMTGVAAGCDVSCCGSGDLGRGHSAIGPDDVLTMRLGLGSALGGLILWLSPPTCPRSPSSPLPRSRQSRCGGRQHPRRHRHPDGGPRGPRRLRRARFKPLTYQAASLVLVLEALVVAVLAIVIGGTQMPTTLITARLTPGPVLILMVWALGLVLFNGPDGRALAESGQPPDGQQRPRGHRTAMTESRPPPRGPAPPGPRWLRLRRRGHTDRRSVLERSRDAIADRIGLSGVLFGATVFAAATSLPELSAGLRRFVMATTSSPYPTSSAETPSCRCFFCPQRCCQARRVAGRPAHRHLFTALESC